MDLKIGMIGLSGGSSIIQKLICFFTSSKYSHSFTIIDVMGIPSIMETTSTIIEVVSAETMGQDDGKDWFIIYNPVATNEEKLAAVKNNYRKYSGKRYAYLSYLWFMYRWFVRKFGYEPKHMWDWVSEGFTCTQFTCTYLVELNKPIADLFKGRDLNTIAPEELDKIIHANPHLFIPIFSKSI